jgi:hypothetical protein
VQSHPVSRLIAELIGVALDHFLHVSVRAMSICKGSRFRTGFDKTLVV